MNDPFKKFTEKVIRFVRKMLLVSMLGFCVVGGTIFLMAQLWSGDYKMFLLNLVAGAMAGIAMNVLIKHQRVKR